MEAFAVARNFDGALGKRLQAARKFRKLTQQIVSNASGIGRAQIANMEGGRSHIYAYQVAWFARYYNLPVGYFYGDYDL